MKKLLYAGYVVAGSGLVFFLFTLALNESGGRGTPAAFIPPAWLIGLLIMCVAFLVMAVMNLVIWVKTRHTENVTLLGHMPMINVIIGIIPIITIVAAYIWIMSDSVDYGFNPPSKEQLYTVTDVNSSEFATVFEKTVSELTKQDPDWYREVDEQNAINGPEAAKIRVMNAYLVRRLMSGTLTPQVITDANNRYGVPITNQASTYWNGMGDIYDVYSPGDTQSDFDEIISNSSPELQKSLEEYDILRYY